MIRALALVLALICQANAQRLPPAPLDRGPVERARPAHCGHCTAVRPLCRQIATCREAFFHLNECGHLALDANRDGVPCEATACRHMTTAPRPLPHCRDERLISRRR